MIKQKTRPGGKPTTNKEKNKRSTPNFASVGNSTKDRVFLRVDDKKLTTIYQTLDTWADQAETMRVICKEYGLDPSLHDLWLYLNSRNKFETDIVKAVCGKYEGDRLYNFVSKDVVAELHEKCPFSLWIKFEHIDESLLKFLVISEDNIDIDVEALEEDCKIYASGRALEVYKNLEKACCCLNKVFNGSTWRFGAMWQNAVFQVDTDGVIKPRKDINFNYIGT